MTVHDIEDGDSFVASGIAVCIPGATVTVTGVRPHAGSSGLQVIGFATFVEPVKAESDVPISLRGSLSEVKAPTSSGRVTTACASSKDAQAKEHTFHRLGGHQQGTRSGFLGELHGRVQGRGGPVRHGRHSGGHHRVRTDGNDWEMCQLRRPTRPGTVNAG